MGMFLQIAIGILPALLVFAALAIFKKKGRVVSIVLGSVFGVLALSSLGMHLFYTPEYNDLSEKENEAYLNLTYAIVGNEDGAEYSKELLGALREDGVDNGRLTLCEAYLCAMQGDAAGAKALYQKANTLLDLDDDEFLTLCEAAISEGKIDFLTAEYLGKEVEGAKGHAFAKLKSYAKNQLESSLSSDEYVTAANALIGAEQLFDSYAGTDDPDRSGISYYTKKLDDVVEKLPELASVPAFKESRLKLNILSGRYKDSAKLIDESSSYNELAVVSELYINNLISESAFSEDYGKVFREQSRTVVEQLEKVKDRLPEDDKVAEKNISSLLERLKGVSSTPALYRMKDAISKVASDESSSDRAKAYLQLAKIEYKEGDKDAAQMHITSSLSTVGVSDDDSFLIPMSNIVGIIGDKDDPEKLKNIAEYVNDVIDHSSDEVVVKALKDAKGDGDLPSGNDEDGDPQPTFEDYMTDTVNQTRISFDISGVDASGFDTVKVTINVDDGMATSAEELRQYLKLVDCGIEIDDFTIEKVEFSGANVLLCCDTSGSMGGQPITDLRNAVVTFIETSPDIETIALVTFSSGIESEYPFGTSNTVMIDAAKQLYASGGTNMYDAIVKSLEDFSSSPNEINYILLLSDGQDGTRHDASEIASAIGDVAIGKGVTLYSLGLGNGVDAEYMSQLAVSTGGSYIYVPDSATLDSFYETLRNQVLNRYVITFKAKDTLRADREVKVYHKDHASVVYDTQKYSLRGDDGTTDPNGGSESNVSLHNKAVYGINPKLVYRSNKETTVKLTGEGFSENDTFSVELDGTLKYGNEVVTCKYVDSTTVDITLPAGIACGTYDLYVHINDQTGIVTKALTVVDQGNQKTTKFGPYVFTSFAKAESGNTATLSNHVVLNNWLSFEGDVVLTGSLSGYEIKMTDTEGCYVAYDLATADGFAATLAKRCQVLSLGSLGTVTLYNDPDVSADSDEYPVSDIAIPLLLMPSLLEMDSPSVQLYPNKLVVDTDGFSTDLPLQDVLMKSQTKELFSFEASLDGVVTGKSVGFEAEVELGTDTDDGKNSSVNFGGFKLNLFDANAKLHLSTVENSFGFDFKVELPSLFKDAKVGLKMDWKEQTDKDGKDKIWLDTVGFGVDIPVKGHIGPVPITVDDFKLEVSGIKPDTNFFLSVFKGSFDLGISKVKDYLPGLEKNVGDVSLAKFDDTALEFSFGEKYIAVSTTLKLLEKIQIGHAEIKAGYIPFDILLLGMESEYANGLQASVTQGIIWNSDNVSVDITGTGTISAHSRLFTVEYLGKASIDIGWWIFNKNFYASGRALVGLYYDSYDDFTFAVIARETTNRDGKEYYLTWNERTSLDYGTRKV